MGHSLPPSGCLTLAFSVPFILYFYTEFYKTLLIKALRIKPYLGPEAKFSSFRDHKLTPITISCHKFYKHWFFIIKSESLKGHFETKVYQEFQQLQLWQRWWWGWDKEVLFLLNSWKKYNLVVYPIPSYMDKCW